MQKFLKVFDRVLSVAAAVTLITMMLHVVLHAILRSTIKAPIYGTNEIVAFWYLPLVALLGIPAAQIVKEHIAVSLVVDQVSTGAAKTFRFFGFSLAILVSIGFAYFGFGDAMEKMEMGATAGVTDITTWPVYFLVPVIFVLLAVIYIYDLVVALKGDGSTVNLATGQETGLEAEIAQEAERAELSEAADAAVHGEDAVAGVRTGRADAATARTDSETR